MYLVNRILEIISLGIQYILKSRDTATQYRFKALHQLFKERKIERETLGFVGSADSGRGCSACYSAKVTRYGAPLLSCVDSLCQFKQLERSQGGGGPLKLVCPVNLIKVRLSLRSSGKPTGLDMQTLTERNSIQRPSKSLRLSLHQGTGHLLRCSIQLIQRIGLGKLPSLSSNGGLQNLHIPCFGINLFGQLKQRRVPTVPSIRCFKPRRQIIEYLIVIRRLTLFSALFVPFSTKGFLNITEQNTISNPGGSGQAPELIPITLDTIQ
ncbi:hypothetical protein F8388_025500 [Cannabis sativa]|uniref:Uncharacterized protein n=1 Tax=Cannabis sativa TaxID=3483 RepID=A0A7J6G3J5_CANSA|nr:hypothetical protein F8388_025500 [Cannabis sativa]